MLVEDQSHAASSVAPSPCVSPFFRLVGLLRNAVSVVLLLVSVVALITGVAVFPKTNTFQGGPIVDSILLVFAFMLLFVCEGMQVALLGVRFAEPESLGQRAQRCRELIFPTGQKDRLPRIFLGQSFLVVLSTFLIAQITTFPYFPAVVGIPDWFISLLLRSGLAGVCVCVNIAQLLPSTLAQRNSALFLTVMPGVYSVLNLALLIESVGIVHATFLIVRALRCMFVDTAGYAAVEVPAKTEHLEASNKTLHDSAQVDNLEAGSSSKQANAEAPLMSDKPSSSHDSSSAPPSSRLVAAQDALRMGLSLAVLLASAAFLAYNIVEGNSLVKFYPLGLFVLLAVIWTVVFHCEAVKIAVVGTSHLSREAYSAAGYPLRIYDLLHPVSTGSTGSHVTETGQDGVCRFLLGRQTIVVPCGFLLANLLHFSGAVYNDMSPIAKFWLLGLGVPGMLVTMQLAQLGEEADIHNIYAIPCHSMSYHAMPCPLFFLPHCAYLLSYSCTHYPSPPTTASPNPCTHYPTPSTTASPTPLPHSINYRIP